MTTLNELLARLTIQQLKSLLHWVPHSTTPVKKDQLVAGILQSLSGEGLRAHWELLDDTQRLAVAEAVYDIDGVFHANRFQAKYGRLPEFTAKNPERFSSIESPTALGLFLYLQDGYDRLPTDMREHLKTFVPEPEPVRLNTIDMLPEMFDENPLTVRNSERDAIADLAVLLRLAGQGKIQVSEKTSLPGSATLRLLTETLAGGDFYSHQAKERSNDQEVGPLKAFSWPLLLQAAGLLQANGSKVALSTAGVKALSSSPASVLRAIWSKWLKSSLFDEFSRIDVIKGQKSKGRVMTALAPRRAVINQALKCCSVGAWITVDEFSRFMQATDQTFAVTHDRWKLYIEEQDYGHLGHAGYGTWETLQLRYLLCFLFEYAATLGIIDVAYVDPRGARGDFSGMWGTDDLQFFSRYDGLVYFRLTPLGAYCLGLSEDYTVAAAQPGVRLSVLPGLQVNVVEGKLSTEEFMMLDTWSVEATKQSWRLDRGKALEAIEKGHDISELQAFLQARDDQPLPETVESFITTTRKKGKALTIKGTALLIDCDDAETAAMIASRKEAAGLCLRAGDRQLVVRLEKEEKFRALIRSLGVGITRS
jgi:hypothetical protein